MKFDDDAPIGHCLRFRLGTASRPSRLHSARHDLSSGADLQTVEIMTFGAIAPLSFGLCADRTRRQHALRSYRTVDSNRVALGSANFLNPTHLRGIAAGGANRHLALNFHRFQPAREGAKPQHRQHSGMSEQASPVKNTVVEDDAAISRVLQLELQHEGYAVEIARWA